MWAGCVLHALFSVGLQFPISSVVDPSFIFVGFLGFWLNTTSYDDMPSRVWYCVLSAYGKNFAFRDQL